MPRDDVYIPNVPVDQPADSGRVDEIGMQVNRTQVATELGVKIYFDVRTRDFRAKLPGDSEGRGSAQELHSADFGALLERIRQRALVVPIKGYLLWTHDGRYSKVTGDPVNLEPCEIIEYHPTRNAPFIVRYRANTKRGEQVITRASGEVYVPTPPQVDALRSALLNLIATQKRHHEEEEAARAAVLSARNAINTVDPATLRYVQQTGRQAIDAEALGLPVFTMEEGDDADDDESEATD